MGRGQAERREDFKHRDDGQPASEHEHDPRPFRDVPADVGVEVIAAHAGVDAPCFHRVAGKDVDAARDCAIDSDHAVGKKEHGDNGDQGIGARCLQTFFVAEFQRDPVRPRKTGERINREEQHDVGVDGGTESANDR